MARAGIPATMLFVRSVGGISHNPAEDTDHGDLVLAIRALAGLAEGNYEGVFNIDVEAEPHAIDIEFVEGPEAGNWNYGIFRLDGDQLEICLDLNGKPRPPGFRTSPGSGHACETLTRTSHARPQNVTGGTASTPPTPPPAQDPEGFEFTESATLAKLQDEWTAT